jgi:mRNA interferase RelE/StbE
MAFTLEWTEASKADYESLDGTQLVFVDKGLARIINFGMKAGEPLGGNLVGYRKLKNKKQGLRIVFRELPHGIEIIQIVAIGKRGDFEVYKMAGRRL